jgi:hypothetical protein
MIDDSPVMVEQGSMMSEPWGWQGHSQRPYGLDMDAEGTFAPTTGHYSVSDTLRHWDLYQLSGATSLMPEPSHTIDHGNKYQELDREWSKVAPMHEARPQISMKAPTSHISPAEWAAHRAEITDLYRHRGWTLPRIMQEMTNRGFRAS